MHEEDDVKEWLRFANMDLATANHLFNTMYPKPYEIICYHCQQAAEKYLKALFVKNQKELVKTHDLVVLAKSLSDVCHSVSDILRECAILTPYGVRIRYPQEMPLEEDDVRLALDYAEKIKVWAEFFVK